jgi:hypothetical protein
MVGKEQIVGFLVGLQHQGEHILRIDDIVFDDPSTRHNIPSDTGTVWPHWREF